jgi:hypothetical protein
LELAVCDFCFYKFAPSAQTVIRLDEAVRGS